MARRIGPGWLAATWPDDPTLKEAAEPWMAELREKVKGYGAPTQDRARRARAIDLELEVRDPDVIARREAERRRVLELTRGVWVDPSSGEIVEREAT